MPDRYIHKKISELLLGNACENTHAYIDKYVKEMGRGHREKFHDPVSAFLIGFCKDGVEGGFSGLLHILADDLFGTYVSKESLRYGLKMAEHALGKMEKSKN